MEAAWTRTSGRMCVTRVGTNLPDLLRTYRPPVYHRETRWYWHRPVRIFSVQSVHYSNSKALLSKLVHLNWTRSPLTPTNIWLLSVSVGKGTMSINCLYLLSPAPIDCDVNMTLEAWTTKQDLWLVRKLQFTLGFSVLQSWFASTSSR